MSCRLIDHPNDNCVIALSSGTEVIGVVENNRSDADIRIVSIGYLNNDSHLYFYKKEEWDSFVELVNILDNKYKEDTSESNEDTSQNNNKEYLK